MVRRAADVMPLRLLMQGGSIFRLLVMASEFMTKHYSATEILPTHTHTASANL
jgi:hypothetical protein